MASYKVKLKDSDNHELVMTISEGGSTEIASSDFTVNLNPAEIKTSMDAIIAFTAMLTSFNLNSLEIEKS